MGRYVLRRLLRVIPVLVIVTLVTSLLLEAVPGDPAIAILGSAATPEGIEAIHDKLNLDQNVLVRYVDWVGNALQGDLGNSLVNGDSAWGTITSRLPISLELALLSIVFSLLIALFLGSYAARSGGGRFDRVVRGLTSALQSAPSFVWAVLLVLFFAVRWRLFPVTGWTRLSDGVWDNLRSAVLPALSLSLIEIAIFTRVLRTDMTTTLQEDFVLAARSKGLRERRVLFGHALRPSLFSLVTVAGVAFGRLLGGTVIVESFFDLPGIGTLLIKSIGNKDYTMVQAGVVFLAVVYVVISVLVDILYGALDPRIRLQGART